MLQTAQAACHDNLKLQILQPSVQLAYVLSHVP